MKIPYGQQPSCWAARKHRRCFLMAEKEKPSGGPSGMAGLVRYYEDEKSVLKLKPEHVIYICMGIFLLELVMLLAFRI